METALDLMKSLNEQAKEIVAMREQLREAGIASPQASTSGASTSLHLSPQAPHSIAIKAPGYSQAEHRLKRLFPINHYTEAMEHLLNAPIVRRFIYLEVMRKLYGDNPPTRPDAEYVIHVYANYIFDKRFQVRRLYIYACNNNS